MTTSGVIIEVMKKEDISGVIFINQQSSLPVLSLKTYLQAFAKGGDNFYVAKKAAKICGYIDFLVVLDEIHLLSVATHPEHRREHIASQLFEQMLGLSPHYKTVQLEVRESNTAAQSFYRKLGFEVVGRRPRYYGDDEHALSMTRFNTFFMSPHASPLPASPSPRGRG